MSRLCLQPHSNDLSCIYQNSTSTFTLTVTLKLTLTLVEDTGTPCMILDGLAGAPPEQQWTRPWQ